MTRLVGGTAGGRRLRTPPGEATRPTSERVREAMFSSLEAALGGLEGCRVLDLYAGSGALGLEALSRGAAALTSVEADRRTARLIERNALDVGLAEGIEVLALPVARVLAGSPGAPYDLVLADPPYPLGEDELAEALTLLARSWLAEEAVVVVERSSRSPEPTWPPGLVPLRRRRYGETALWYVRAAADPAA